MASVGGFQESQLGWFKQLSASHQGKEKGLPLVNTSDCKDGEVKLAHLEKDESDEDSRLFKQYG